MATTRRAPCRCAALHSLPTHTAHAEIAPHLDRFERLHSAAALVQSSRMLGNSLSNTVLTAQLHTVQQWAQQPRVRVQGILDAPVREAMHAGDLWYMQGQDATVLDAVKDMLQRRVRSFPVMFQSDYC